MCPLLDVWPMRTMRDDRSGSRQTRPGPDKPVRAPTWQCRWATSDGSPGDGLGGIRPAPPTVGAAGLYSCRELTA